MLERPDTIDDYVIDIIDSPAKVDPSAWAALLAVQGCGTPFLKLEYLRALHDSGSAVAQTGWLPQWVLLRSSDGQLEAAALLYLKSHSYGEYVFDWAWADAYRRHGLRYYPKLLSAVPFTPCTGPRLLARTTKARQALLQLLPQLASRNGLSSLHLLFVSEAEHAHLQDAASMGWMMRTQVQFHWLCDTAHAGEDFDHFLSRLQRHKRKNIVQERRRVRDAGVTFTVHEGSQIGSADWDHFYLCHQATYAARGSKPYLTREFFDRMAQQMPEHWLMFVGWQQGQRVAASLVAIDRPTRCAWGRYWGSLRPLDAVHFEACYYQPLAWCLAQGFVRFEGGAQGEHKMARGLMPQTTYSAHWLSNPQFAQAVDRFLSEETLAIDEYQQSLQARSPFRQDR